MSIRILFQEGSYTGKGIYEVDHVRGGTGRTLRGNSVLSHDLLEGIVVRAGHVSDIEVVEEFPSRYDVSSCPAASLGAGRLAAAALDHQLWA